MRVDLIVEDSGHELFLRPLIRKLGYERHVPIDIRTVSSAHGRPKVLAEANGYAETSAALGVGLPDTLIVATDGNCVGFVQRRNEVVNVLGKTILPLTTVAIPDPHIERWLLADPAAFRRAVGKAVQPPRRKCDRDFYKGLLAKSVADAGHVATLGGLEFARDIVEEMDIGRACRNDNSLNNFVRSFRGAVTRFASRDKQA